MPLLTGEQTITYYKNDVLVIQLTANLVKPMFPGLAGYLRGYQPFVKPGEGISIPIPNDAQGKTWGDRKSSRAQRVERLDNDLVITTAHSTYRIEYRGIDLERVLADGENNGVNAGDELEFPSLLQS